jgi:hypothetical protein
LNQTMIRLNRLRRLEACARARRAGRPAPDPYRREADPEYLAAVLGILHEALGPERFSET